MGLHLAGAPEWSDISLSFILNAIILIYVMLPGVKQAFDADYFSVNIMLKEINYAKMRNGMQLNGKLSGRHYPS